MSTLKSLSSSLSLAIVEVPLGKDIQDIFLTPQNKLAVITCPVSAKGRENNCELDVLNISGLEYTEIPIRDTSRHILLHRTIESMIESKSLNDYPTEKNKTLPGKNYGYLHANTKGLLTVADGNNILIVNVDD